MTSLRLEGQEVPRYEHNTNTEEDKNQETISYTADTAQTEETADAYATKWAEYL